MVPALYCLGFTLVLLAAIALLVAYTYARARGFGMAARLASTHHLRQRAQHILAEAREAIRRSHIPNERKTTLGNEARELYNNIAHGIWKLDRVRKIRELAMKGPATADSIRIVDDADQLESHLTAEINRSLDVLLSVPASLLKVEVAQGDRVVDHLIQSLDETNLRMRDMADAYADVRSASYSHSKV